MNLHCKATDQDGVFQWESAVKSVVRTKQQLPAWERRLRLQPQTEVAIDYTVTMVITASNSAYADEGTQWLPVSCVDDHMWQPQNCRSDMNLLSEICRFRGRQRAVCLASGSPINRAVKLDRMDMLQAIRDIWWEVKPTLKKKIDREYCKRGLRLWNEQRGSQMGAVRDNLMRSETDIEEKAWLRVL